MKKILFIFLVTLLIGCNRHSKKIISTDEYQKLVRQTIFVIPDSLRTKEQLQLSVKFYDFYNQHIYVENNCLKLSVEKELMEKEGIPAFYYDILQYQLEEHNECIKRWIEEGDIPAIHLNMDSLMKEYKNRYKEVDRPNMLKLLESK